MTFDARPYLKEIARGPSARPLDRGQARALFAAIFGEAVAPAALGAVLVALRIKGETLDEVAGMMDALAAYVRPLSIADRGARPVLLPTYNGARKLPNLVPLLALRLAAQGIPVVVHGAHQESSRVGSFEILAKLGHAPVDSLEQAQSHLAATNLAVVPLSLISPALARLVDMRLQLGVRNSGHTLAKLLLPGDMRAADACRLVPVTHPEFLQLMHDYLLAESADAYLLRGVEGEAVLRLHAPQPVEEFVPGAPPRTRTIEGDADENALPEREAGATAQWTTEVLAGRGRVPFALEQQVEMIARHCRERRS